MDAFALFLASLLGRTWTCLDMPGHAWTCLGMLGQACLDMLGSHSGHLALRWSCLHTLAQCLASQIHHCLVLTPLAHLYSFLGIVGTPLLSFALLACLCFVLAWLAYLCLVLASLAHLCLLLTLVRRLHSRARCVAPWVSLWPSCGMLLVTR